jgi:hypothetical protein
MTPHNISLGTIGIGTVIHETPEQKIALTYNPRHSGFTIVVLKEDKVVGVKSVPTLTLPTIEVEPNFFVGLNATNLPEFLELLTVMVQRQTLEHAP